MANISQKKNSCYSQEFFRPLILFGVKLLNKFNNFNWQWSTFPRKEYHLPAVAKKVRYIVLALTYFPMKIVSSALECLTSEFGMGSGVATPLEVPGIYIQQATLAGGSALVGLTSEFGMARPPAFPFIKVYTPRFNGQEGGRGSGGTLPLESPEGAIPRSRDNRPLMTTNYQQ